MNYNALKLKDEGVYLVKLPRGTYKIDGKVLNIEGYSGAEVECDSIEILPVSVTEIVTHYENSTGDTLSADGFNDKRQKLLECCDEDGYWSSLEAEFEYKKLTRDWTAVNRKVTQIGDPLPIEVHEVTADLDCKFIKPILSTKDVTKLYEYDRAAATLHLTEQTFSELGMSFDKGVGYGSTSGKKIWSNANHSHLEYVVAFGKYLWTKNRQPKKGVIRGTLQECCDTYNQDVNYIETKIKSEYNLHFNRANIDLELLVKRIRTIYDGLLEVQSKQKTYSQLRSCKVKMSELIEDIEKELANN